MNYGLIYSPKIFKALKNFYQQFFLNIFFGEGAAFTAIHSNSAAICLQKNNAKRVHTCVFHSLAFIFCCRSCLCGISIPIRAAVLAHHPYHIYPKAFSTQVYKTNALSRKSPRAYCPRAFPQLIFHYRLPLFSNFFHLGNLEQCQ
ncbi:hypothetical protein MSHRCOH1_02780 [Candidatus Ornithobacterium hominis]|nr:hypothetical protein MSHRCOH1_02780 [Candidatus Ornithobacterium hominis]